MLACHETNVKSVLCREPSRCDRTHSLHKIQPINNIDVSSSCKNNRCTNMCSPRSALESQKRKNIHAKASHQAALWEMTPLHINSRALAQTRTHTQLKHKHTASESNFKWSCRHNYWPQPQTRTHAHIHTCKHTRTHAHIHTYMQAHAHTYTHEPIA